MPVTVTAVAPADGPWAGAMNVTVGAGEQPANLNVPIRVCQLNEPFVVRYSVVYQKVQSSVGSTTMEL